MIRKIPFILTIGIIVGFTFLPEKTYFLEFKMKNLNDSMIYSDLKKDSVISSRFRMSFKQEDTDIIYVRVMDGDYEFGKIYGGCSKSTLLEVLRMLDTR